MIGDGKGPAVRWFPRFMRPWVNRWFRQMGWAEPYDTEGNKIPRSQRTIPNESPTADDDG